MTKAVFRRSIYSFICALMIIASLSIFTTGATAQTADGEITVLLDGKLINFDVQPLIIQDRTMVPVRAIFEALGADVVWNPEARTVEAVRNGTVVKLIIDSNTAYKDGTPCPLDVPPMIVNSRTLVPLRFISEAFGAQVSWDPAQRKVTIISGGSTANGSYDQEPPARGEYRHWVFQSGVSIGDIAISENGSRLVVGDQGGKLYLFGRDNAVPIWTYTAEHEQFNSVALSRDGNVVAAASTDGRIHLFVNDSPSPRWVFDNSGTPGATIEDVAVSADGRFIAAIDYSKIYLFSLNSNVPIKTFSVALPDNQWLTTLAISGDGSCIAAGTWISDEGAEMFVYNREKLLWSHKTEYKPQSENAVKMPIAISLDGSYLACGGSDGQLHFFSRNSSRPLWSYDVSGGNPEQVSSIAMSDNGKRLVAAGSGMVFFFDDTAKAEPAWSCNGEYSPPLMIGNVPVVYPDSDNEPGYYGIGHSENMVAISADGRYAAAGVENSGHLFSFFRGIGRPFRMYDLSYDYEPVSNVVLSADGAWIAAGGTYGSVHMWEVAPALMIELHTPVALTITPGGSGAASDAASEAVDLDDLVFTRYLVKPGRAAELKETWSIWANVGGIPLSPGALEALSGFFGGGDFEKEYTWKLPAGNYDSVKRDSMEVPTLPISSSSTMSLMFFRAQLEDNPSGRDLSDESHLFVQVQASIGGS